MNVRVAPTIYIIETKVATVDAYYHLMIAPTPDHFNEMMKSGTTNTIRRGPYNLVASLTYIGDDWYGRFVNLLESTQIGGAIVRPSSGVVRYIPAHTAQLMIMIARAYVEPDLVCSLAGQPTYAELARAAKHMEKIATNRASAKGLGKSEDINDGGNAEAK